MSKLIIVTKFKNAVGTITKTFKIPRMDETTKKKVWDEEVDFKVVPIEQGTTNYMLVNDTKNWSTLTYDLSKIERADGKAEDTVSIYEIIESICKAAPNRVGEGAIKIVVDETNKKDVLKAIKEGLISKENNTVTDVVLVKKQVSALPDFTADFSDEDITGMEDIEKEIKKAKKVKADEIAEDLENILK